MLHMCAPNIGTWDFIIYKRYYYENYFSRCVIEYFLTFCAIVNYKRGIFLVIVFILIEDLRDYFKLFLQISVD